MAAIDIDKTAEEIHSLILSTECDARAEMILTELLAGKVDMDQILIRPQGLHNRPFKRDIYAVQTSGNRFKRIEFQLSREGLYDYLPKGMFFPLKDSSPRLSASQMTDNVRKNKIITDNARTFFTPFDTVFNMARVEAEQQGRTLSDIVGEGNFGPLGIIWELPAEMSLREKGLLIMLLPFSRTIGSKPELLSGLYSLFFNTSFTVSAPRLNTTYDPCEGAPLNDCHLGYSSVLGGNVSSIQSEVEIKYELNSTAEADLFAPDERNDQLLNYLNGLFLLADSEIIKQPDMAKIKNHYILDDDQKIILGYSSYLQEIE